MFWLFGFRGGVRVNPNNRGGGGVRVKPNIVRIVMHIEIYGRSLSQGDLVCTTVNNNRSFPPL